MASSGDNPSLGDAKTFVSEAIHHPHAVADLLRSDVPELYSNVQGGVADTSRLRGTWAGEAITVPLQLSGDGRSTLVNSDPLTIDAITADRTPNTAIAIGRTNPIPSGGSPVARGMTDTLADAVTFKENPTIGGAWNVARNAAYSATVAPRETVIKLAESSLSAVVDEVKKVNPF